MTNKYISSSLWLLEIESRDFSQAEKIKTASKAEQIHKMTTIFNQNDNLGVEIEICQSTIYYAGLLGRWDK